MKIKNLELVLQASVESIVKKTTEGFLPVITRVQDHMKYLQGEIQLLSTTLRNHHTPTTEHNMLMVDSLSKVSSRQEDIGGGLLPIPTNFLTKQLPNNSNSAEPVPGDGRISSTTSSNMSKQPIKTTDELSPNQHRSTKPATSIFASIGNYIF